MGLNKKLSQLMDCPLPTNNAHIIMSTKITHRVNKTQNENKTNPLFLFFHIQYQYKDGTNHITLIILIKS